MIYADSNLFIYAAIGEEIGEKAAVFLSETPLRLATSFLSIDEIAWGIARKRGIDEALAFCGELLAGRITLLEVNAAVAKEALKVIRTNGLRPRDSFHAATMRLHGINTIVSEDKDFDKLPGVKRMWFKK